MQTIFSWLSQTTYPAATAVPAPAAPATSIEAIVVKPCADVTDDAKAKTEKEKEKIIVNVQYFDPPTTQVNKSMDAPITVTVAGAVASPPTPSKSKSTELPKTVGLPTTGELVIVVTNASKEPLKTDDKTQKAEETTNLYDRPFSRSSVNLTIQQSMYNRQTYMNGILLSGVQSVVLKNHEEIMIKAAKEIINYFIADHKAFCILTMELQKMDIVQSLTGTKLPREIDTLVKEIDSLKKQVSTKQNDTDLLIHQNKARSLQVLMSLMLRVGHRVYSVGSKEIETIVAIERRNALATIYRVAGDDSNKRRNIVWDTAEPITNIPLLGNFTENVQVLENDFRDAMIMALI
jgi:hypothetical protein